MILVTGDSFTAGEESPIAWPELIPGAINYAGPGFSNDAILKTTVEMLELTTWDSAIVCWTTPHRIEIGDMHLTPSSTRKYGSICEALFLDWNEDWAVRKFRTQVLLLDSYLRDKGIPYLFVRTFDVPTFNVGNWADGSMVEWMGDCPKGPGGHPLELGQQRIAEHVNEHIRNIGRLS
jgi:hypothetical protein